MRFCRPATHIRLRSFSALILFAGLFLVPLQPTRGQDGSGEQLASLSDGQLEELVGPIALYPDKLIAIILPASTYPLEVVQADRLLEKNKNKMSDDAIKQLDFDTSILALMHYPEVLDKMNENLDWTTNLGDAVANEQEEVMRNHHSQRRSESLMAHPVVQSTATSTTGTNSSTHTITVPSGVVSGDLLIAFIAIENSTSPASQFSGVTDGFTEIRDKSTGGTAGASVGVFFKVSDGTEGANITVTSVDSDRAAHCMYRISGFNSAIDPEITAGASGNSTSPDPDSLSPAGGAKDYLYMVFAAYERATTDITAFPTNYGSNQINHFIAAE